MTKAIFLDKDGTLIENVPYNVVAEHMKLCDRALIGAKMLHTAGYKLFVITNQSGIARGYFPESALISVEQCLRDLLRVVDVPISGFYYCPHHPEGTVSGYAIDCTCRKPQPGLLQRAAAEHAIDLTQSWFIGDILHDIEAGRAAGCRTILINNGNETEWQLSPQRLPHHLVANIQEAAHVILAIDAVEQMPSDNHHCGGVAFGR